MKESEKTKFQKLWETYFKEAELPLTAYYTDKDTISENKSNNSCLIANLNKARKGKPIRFSANSIGCPGGRRHTGFSNTLSKDFEYFLSRGIPGKLEGERYKKTPVLVHELLKDFPKFNAPRKYIVFKRWDKLDEADEPEIVIFFATPDVLSGLFTLANFDRAEDGVRAPFGSGCSSLIMHPFLEGEKEAPHCILGMFDPSARPYVGSDTLTFAMPMNRFRQMMNNMEESFLITSTWKKNRNRL